MVVARIDSDLSPLSPTPWADVTALPTWDRVALARLPLAQHRTWAPVRTGRGGT